MCSRFVGWSLSRRLGWRRRGSCSGFRSGRTRGHVRHLSVFVAPEVANIRPIICLVAAVVLVATSGRCLRVESEIVGAVPAGRILVIGPFTFPAPAVVAHVFDGRSFCIHGRSICIHGRSICILLLVLIFIFFVVLFEDSAYRGIASGAPQENPGPPAGNGRSGPALRGIRSRESEEQCRCKGGDKIWRFHHVRSKMTLKCVVMRRYNCSRIDALRSDRSFGG